MNSKKILVTGGAGFIGSHLVDQLIKLGHSVAVVDDLSSGNKNNLNSQVNFINTDISNKGDLSTAINQLEPDLVFHLAAKIQATATDTSLIKRVNVIGTKNLTECLSGQPIVFASSVAVYGDAQDSPIKETSLLKPLSLYGRSKLEGERIIQNSGLPYTIFRFANVYGPRQTDTAEGGAVAIFFKQAINNQPLTIFDDGNQTRDFVFVKDIVQGLSKVVDRPQNDVFNLSSQQAISVNQLAKKIISITSSKSKLTHQPARKGDIYHSLISNAKSINKLDFKPQFNCDQGLKDYYDFLKK